MTHIKHAVILKMKEWIQIRSDKELDHLVFVLERLSEPRDRAEYFSMVQYHNNMFLNNKEKGSQSSQRHQC